MWFLLILVSFAVCEASDDNPSTSKIYDTIIDKVDCGCNRTVDDLDVSKMKIKVINYESNNHEDVYSIANAAEEIMSRKDFNPLQCIQIFVNGLFSTNNNDAKCIFSKINCNGLKPLGLIIDHSEYTDGNILQSINAIGRYKRSVKYAKSIGKNLGHFLVKILEKVDRNNIDIAGFSLGAHIVGYMGEVVYRETGSKLKRIYLTDPAGPCYDECSGEGLKSGQADLVVTFHCNCGEYGSKLRVSDYDFISYNGVVQEACGTGSWELVSSFLKSTCSHLKCVPIMYNPDIYRGRKIWQAKKCDSSKKFLNGACDHNESTLAGYRHIPTTSPGTYYFRPAGDLSCDAAAAEFLITKITHPFEI